MPTTNATAARAYLQAVRDLLADPAHWTQAAFAREATGLPTTPTGPKAVCWCLLGAMRHVASAHPAGRAAALARLRGRLPWVDLASWNDSHPHAEVLALLDSALQEWEPSDGD